MRVSRGVASPLGSSVLPNVSESPLVTVNFAVYAQVPSLTLVLFPPLSSSLATRDPFASVPFTARTGDVWHIVVQGLHPDAAYALATPAAPYRLLPDPYARWIESAGCNGWMTVEGERFHGEGSGDTAVGNVKAFLRSFPRLRDMRIEFPFRPCRFTAPHESRAFDWGDEATPNVSYDDLLIYEAHVRALTPEGTFTSAIRIIPYLKWLGITALQLMPIFEFSEIEMGSLDGDYNLLSNERTSSKPPEERHGNWWGYSPMSWFCPINRYAASTGGGAAELKALVKALHAEGIECFLDVVYNHSANASCPLHFLKVQRDYYMGTNNGDSFHHSNVSGCGNTLSPNSPLMLQLVLESLRWFVTEYRIDGFRIDAAGVFCRDQQGHRIDNPEVINHICSDPVLRHTKLIVEGWDAGDQIGSPNMLLGSKHGFPRGERFCEWNVEWRDAVRTFFRGDKDSAKPFCRALRGSPKLFADGKCPSATRPLGANHGINFVSCHDGFSMADVVSYRKRVNTDGYKEISFNCGAKGKTSDHQIQARRAQQLRNFMFALAISRGVPMICQGDEFGFSKQGNNNTWNNPELFAAKLPTRPEDCENFERLSQFTRRIFELRCKLRMLKGSDFFADITWLDESGMDRNLRKDSSPSKKSGFVAFCTKPDEQHSVLFLAFNNSNRDVSACLPGKDHSRTRWTRLIDTWSSCSESGSPENDIKSLQITVRNQSSVLYKGVFRD